MEHVELNMIEPVEKSGRDVAAFSSSLVSKQFATRGLARAVLNSAAEQQKNEEYTRALSPEAYRLSEMNEAAVSAYYRLGKEYMSTSDLLRYAADSRRAHLQGADLCGNTGIDECTGSNVLVETKALTEKRGESAVVPVSCGRKLSVKAVKKISAALPTWFDSSAPDTHANNRRFPLSAIAAMLAVAASLLLIVASSVMIRLAESDVSRLKTQLSDASAVACELRSDFEVQNDLLQIRSIATEEYGMVSEEYVKMDYITLSGEDSVEAFEEEREEAMGLSALLSAIGLR